MATRSGARAQRGVLIFDVGGCAGAMGDEREIWFHRGSGMLSLHFFPVHVKGWLLFVGSVSGIAGTIFCLEKITGWLQLGSGFAMILSFPIMVGGIGAYMSTAYKHSKQVRRLFDWP